MDKEQEKRENLEESESPDKKDTGQEQSKEVLEEKEEGRDPPASQDSTLEENPNNKNDQPEKDNPEELDSTDIQQENDSIEEDSKDVPKTDTEDLEDKVEDKKEDNRAKEKSEEQREKSKEPEPIKGEPLKNDETDNANISENLDNSDGGIDKEGDKDNKDKNEKGDDVESLSDDELWDTESSLDDLDLDIFEDDEEEIISETKEEEDSSQKTKEEISEDKEKNVKNNKDKDREPDKDNRFNNLLKRLPPLRSLVFWGIIALESILIIVGFFTIYALCAPYFKHLNKNTYIVQKSKSKETKKTFGKSSRSKNVNQSSKYPFDKKNINIPSSAKVLGTAIVSLQPFYIPVVYEGDVVFLKLHAKLTVADPNTKAILEHRLTLIRNIIYEDLKGIVIRPEERGNFLLKYCKPLKQALNKELSPYRITDVSLMGFILR